MVLASLVDVGARGGSLAGACSRRSRRSRTGGCSATRYVGYLANNILPARLGELVRSHALGEGEGISRTTVLGTVVVERIVDTVMVVAIAAVGVLVLSVRGVMAARSCSGRAFVTLLVVALGLGMAAHRLPGADRVVAFARPLAADRRARPAPARGPRASRAGRGPWPRRSARAPSPGAPRSSTFLAGGQAVGIELTLAQGALVATGVALATIVPSGPGYLGTFELTAVGDRRRRSASTDDTAVRDGPPRPRHDPRRHLGRRRDRLDPAADRADDRRRRHDRGPDRTTSRTAADAAGRRGRLDRQAVGQPERRRSRRACRRRSRSPPRTRPTARAGRSGEAPRHGPTGRRPRAR